jgi:hypothetical protein
VKRATPALLALAALVGCRAATTEAAPEAKPEIHLLTSLPLLFDEGFGLEPAAGEAATFLRDQVRLKPIDLPSQLQKGAILLAAQPRALPAEQLVALDQWVRGGGRMLLLADPMLEWPSKRPLGHRLRPPLSFADTGLLLHWGLRLDAPEMKGPVRQAGPDSQAEFGSPGRLVKVGGTCRTDPVGIVAECALGAGRVTIVADADWLNPEPLRAAGGEPGGNLAMLGDLLDSLDRRR